jgi:3-hydroxyisobutyrate dehydrogenase
MRIAWLGTGIMGAPMARHVAQAGHDVTVWNRSREKALALADGGAQVAESPPEAVAGAEVVVTMLTDGDAVEHVIREAGPRDAIWWQAGTVGLAATERLAALATESGLRYVDGPVLGTRGPAEEGKLVVMASGTPDAVEACMPLFDAVGGKTLRVGEQPGAAMRLKLVLNHWLVTVTDAMAQTIAYADGLGIDPRMWLQAIEGGTLDIGYAHLKGPGMIEGELPVAFPLKHALKDSNLVLDAAERYGVEAELARVVRDHFARAAEAGHADDDMGMVIAASRASAR